MALHAPADAREMSLIPSSAETGRVLRSAAVDLSGDAVRERIRT